MEGDWGKYFKYWRMLLGVHVHDRELNVNRKKELMNGFLLGLVMGMGLEGGDRFLRISGLYRRREKENLNKRERERRKKSGMMQSRYIYPESILTRARRSPRLSR